MKLSWLYAVGSLSGVLAGIVDLTDKDFQATVLDSGVPTLVDFYASWCGHCKRLAPVLDELSGQFGYAKEKVNIVKIDADKYRKIGKKYGIEYFPTLKWIGSDGKVSDVESGRDIDSLAKFLTEKTGVRPKVAAEAPSYVEYLDDSSFDDIADDTSKSLLVAFTANWCGHCKNLKPEYEKLSAVYKNDKDIVIAYVDATGENTSRLLERFKVKGYPTILYFGKDSTSDGFESYKGGRGVEDFISFINSKHGAFRTAEGLLNEQAGRIPSLDKIANLLTLSDTKDVIFGDLEKEVANLKDEAEKKYGQQYLRYADKIKNSKGLDYINGELARLKRIVTKGALKSDTSDQLQVKINILNSYVPGVAHDEL